MSNDYKQLEQYRAIIDNIDERILALLGERMLVVKDVADYKLKHFPNHCPIRAGREASMLRRIAEISAASSFSAAAAAQIWRIIIGASTALEAPLNISVFAPEGQSDLFWLAREYFGPDAVIFRESHIKRVIGAVIDGKASVGVVPHLEANNDDSWWRNLINSSADAPKIFAHLPMVVASRQLNGKAVANQSMPSALAFARLVPEKSGDDRSLYALEIKHNVSQNRLQGIFSAANINVRWLGVHSLNQETRYHLIEISEFAPPDSQIIRDFSANLGGDLLQAYFLGAYAAPFAIASNNQATIKQQI